MEEVNQQRAAELLKSLGWQLNDFVHDTGFTLIFAARHRLIVRKPSVRQILERLFDFVVFQFDTSLERKKAGTFDFSKSPGHTDFLILFNVRGLHNLENHLRK